MERVTLALLLVLLVVAVIAYRRRRERWYVIIAVGAGLALAIRTSIATSPPASPGLLDIALIALVAVVAAEALGLPIRIGSQLGFGLRSREWEFDRQLTELLRPVNEALTNQPPPDSEAYGAWRRAFLQDAHRRIARLQRLRAPTERWAGAAAAYADIYGRIVDLYETGDFPEKRAEIAVLVNAIDRERESLRGQYREAAAAILARSRMTRLLRSPSTTRGRRFGSAQGNGAGTGDIPDR